MVTTNGFAVSIITDGFHDKLKRGYENYVALDNGAEYKIELRNNRPTEAMAEVHLEGQEIGTWYIPAKSSIIIERPSDINRKFTFFSEHDSRAQKAGVMIGSQINGLVKVIFYPKKDYSKPVYAMFRKPLSTQFNVKSARTMNSQYESGATVFGRVSNQIFGRNV